MRNEMHQDDVDKFLDVIAQARASLDTAEDALFKRDREMVLYALENAANTTADAVGRRVARVRCGVAA